MSSTGEQDWRSLLAEMQSGSLAAFEQLYERFVPLVFHIAYKITGDRMEAEDVCHDVFLEIFHKAHQYDPMRGSMEAWLAVRTKSRALDRLRSRQRIRLKPIETKTSPGTPPASSAEEHVFARLQREALRNALKKIPDKQRTALYGMYYESNTQRELSQKLRHPLGTVKSLIRYGLNSLRRELSASGWAEPAGGAGKNESS